MAQPEKLCSVCDEARGEIGTLRLLLLLLLGSFVFAQRGPWHAVAVVGAYDLGRVSCVVVEWARDVVSGFGFA